MVKAGDAIAAQKAVNEAQKNLADVDRQFKDFIRQLIYARKLRRKIAESEKKTGILETVIGQIPWLVEEIYGRNRVKDIARLKRDLDGAEKAADRALAGAVATMDDIIRVFSSRLEIARDEDINVDVVAEAAGFSAVALRLRQFREDLNWLVISELSFDLYLPNIQEIFSGAVANEIRFNEMYPSK